MNERNSVERQTALIGGARNVVPRGFSESVAEPLRKVVARIVMNLDPEKVILFGSYARGTPTPDSDVDLLVVMRTEAPALQRYLAVSRLIRPRPFPVDILVRTPEEIAHAQEVGDPLICEILSRGRTIYERP